MKVEPGAGLRIELFGGLRVCRDDVVTTRFRTRKTGSLLAYLAFFRGHPHSRELLTDLFWPEANLDAGRQSLRMALSSLRELFGPDSETIVQSDRSTVRLVNVSTDVAEFEEGAASDEPSVLSTALRRVKGPLLAGYDDSWIVAQWLRLEEAYAQAAVRLMEMSQPGDINSGLLIGREATALLGPREDVHLALMKLLAASGQPSQAIAQFEELERLLQDQWGEAPSAQAYALLDSLPRGGRAVPVLLPRGTVPARASSFFGREEEVEQVSRLVSQGQNRLTTLIGIGGCGKTALANVVGHALEAAFGGRVWSIEFADVRDPSRVFGLLAQAVLGCDDAPPSMAKLGESLGSEGALFVLDNLEQLLPEGGIVVKNLLEALPNVRVLGTSRTALSVDGEQLFPVKTLPVPQGVSSLSELAQVPSVALFVDRARASTPEFVLNPSNASAIAEICRRLEGLPLALELAAARATTYSPAQILARLGGSNEFLVSKRADVSERHRSLGSTLAWSLGFLSDQVRQVFAHLGVFRGGFDLESGEGVTQSPTFADDLDVLVKSSLVSSVPAGDEPRFRLLEPVREHAWAMLGTLDLVRVRRAHFDHFRRVVAGMGTGEPGASNKAWLDKLDREHENLTAAFECVFDGVVPVPEAVEFALGARPFFRPRGRSGPWRALLAQLKGSLPEGTDLAAKAKLWLLHAQMSANVTDADTLRSHHREAAELCEAAGDLDGVGQAYSGLGGTYKVSGDYPTSIGYYEKAIAAFKVSENARMLAATIRQMAMSYVSMGDHERTYELLQEALAYARRGGEPDALAWTLTDLGVEHALHGKPEESRACFTEAHEICLASDNSHMRSIVFWQQAETELRTGDPGQSVATHRQCVEHALKADFKEGLKWMLVSHGCALIGAGSLDLGTRVLARADAWRTHEKRPYTGDELEILEPAKATAEDQMGRERYAEIWNVGSSADLDQLVHELLGLQ